MRTVVSVQPPIAVASTLPPSPALAVLRWERESTCWMTSALAIEELTQEAGPPARVVDIGEDAK